MWAMQMGHIDAGADQNASDFKKVLRQKKALEDIFTVLHQFSNCGCTSKC